MDLNIVVLAGAVAAPPEVRSEPNGATLARLLVTVKTDRPRRRVDVVPVPWCDVDGESGDIQRGDRVWVAGAVQRRFWSGGDGRRSRIEIVAHAVRKNASGAWLANVGSPDRSGDLSDDAGS